MAAIWMAAAMMVMMLYEGGVRRRLMSSSPFLSSSTSQRLFLVCLAGGETGSGVSSEFCSLAVSAMTDGGGRLQR